MSDSRNLLFVSHAYPENNLFAEWLMNRLRVEGYESWLDLTRLGGGDRIWPEAEDAIRQRAFRFLFVLSRPSNNKGGTRQELHVAKNVGKTLGVSDFVIPLAVDDLSPNDYNIELAELLSIDFHKGWAPGLNALLTRLEKLGAPKTSSPAEAARLWRVRMSGADRVRPKPATLYSNTFDIRSLPANVYLYSRDTAAECEVIARESKVPAVHSGKRIVSFESRGAVLHPLLADVAPDKGAVHTSRPPDEGGRAVFDATLALLRRAWELGLQKKGLATYVMANERQCLFFPTGLVPDERMSFTTPDFSSWRAPTGHKKAAQWHLGLSARFTYDYGSLGLRVSSHVVFTDDGKTPWESQAAQHRARRSLAKSWWNDKWRDLVLGAMSFLAEGADTLQVSCAPELSYLVDRLPRRYSSPFSYLADEEELSAAAHHDTTADTEEEDDTHDDEDLAHGDVDTGDDD